MSHATPSNRALLLTTLVEGVPLLKGPAMVASFSCSALAPQLVVLFRFCPRKRKPV
jgi:hypothetical protein